MNTKKIILIIIIVGALAGAGVFAYISMTGSGTTPGAASLTATTPATTAGAILPYGTELNFEKINKFNETGRTFEYPSVTPADTGLQLNEIISQ